MESNNLIPVGSEIHIDKYKIKTDLPQTILSKLPKKITGKIIDYKMTDGMGIGYVLMTERKLKFWIFSNELNEESKTKYDISLNEKISSQRVNIGQYIEEFELNGNYKISYLLNPVNIIKWLLYTLKDIL